MAKGKKESAGLLVFRRARDGAEVLLVHPGGPYWKNRDDGAWSIPKGERAADEDALDAAKREFGEETGLSVSGEFLPLRPVKQRSGKTVLAFAVEADCNASAIRSNTFPLEWPPRSGRVHNFPEVDRAQWFSLEAARRKINRGQVPLLDELGAILARKS